MKATAAISETTKTAERLMNTKGQQVKKPQKASISGRIEDFYKMTKTSYSEESFKANFEKPQNRKTKSKNLIFWT